MAKDKKEKPVLNLDDKEYVIEDMTDEQKMMVNHINDLQNKQNTNQFMADQLSVGKEAFINMLRKALEEPEEVEAEETQFLTLSVNPAHLHQLAKQLKEDTDTSFDYMFCQTGIDWEEDLEVVYHLRSTSHGHEVVVRTQITDRENPTVDSVYDLWKTADFHEREIFDLLGIRFTNHPDLIPIHYMRYLENSLREYFGFLGTPIKISFRKGK